ncbi:SAM-dependent methyltransferase [Pelomonas aquatica]|uniref:SAM-dependent methyltransferase n=1 Tax=Pelomonas aquatica TaxID=431058 RepID=A0ABU1Z5C5_9BURK|nr:methyltransferase domain-containing protein [Pelomonas aquatica]MDR7295818.1 SAM-dependent methyltransferase [Pelomonas aquatica]
MARRWCERGDLVDFEILDDRTVTARRVPFVSLPAEWSDLQLFQAAELTLRLQCEAVAAGHDLKDASAWNVIFDGGRPVFCDLLSFEPLTDKRWWAAGQFARHFILPLLLSSKRGLPAYKAFQAWRDGVPHDVARRMLGAGRFLTRYWPLVASAPTPAGRPAAVGLAVVSADDIRRFRTGLDQSLGWMLRGVDPRRRLPDPSAWGNYVAERGHYADTDLDVKRDCIARWARNLAPAQVLDLGCNSGEFSRLAAASGARVIAVDLDHGAISRGVADPASQGIDFLVAPLDDLRGGFGWGAAEHAGLPARLLRQADLTMMLALLHHLVLGASIPLAAVAQFAADCTKRWLVVELIAPQDVQIGFIQAQRNRRDPFPTIEEQEAAFMAAGFAVNERQVLPAGNRTLVLLERVA